MQSSIIGKSEKANRYAQEPERITFRHFEAVLVGSNGDYAVSYSDGHWNCTCNFFSKWQVCSHSMAVEKLLDPMVKIQSTEVLAEKTAIGEV